jgi:hypothetical protein
MFDRWIYDIDENDTERIDLCTVSSITVSINPSIHRRLCLAMHIELLPLPLETRKCKFEDD